MTQLQELVWILFLSISFAYSISCFAHPSPSIRIPPSHSAPPRRSYLAEAKRRKNTSFLRLPLEIQLTILTYSADWPQTYHALICASKHIYRSTLRACLPRLPVILCTKTQLTSFATLLVAHPNAALLVHRLWITPIKRADAPLACAILHVCTNVRALACDARTFGAAVTRPKGPLRHAACQELMLLLSRAGYWEKALDTPAGLAFARRLVRVRVMGRQAVPRVLRFAGAVQLSYMDASPVPAPTPAPEEALWVLNHPEVWPALREVVVVRRCGPKGHPPERVRRGLVVVYVPYLVTEMQVWCEGAKGQGVWDLAALAGH